MINQFRSLSPINILGLFLFTFLMRLAFFTQMPAELNFEFLETYARLLVAAPPATNLLPQVNVLIAGLLVFIQALLFNRVINSHNLMAKAGYLPALMYIMGCSLFLDFLILSPPLIANFLLIWIIDKLLTVGKSANARMLLFDIGMLTALGTVIYFPFVVLVLMLWITLVISRPFNWREWIMGPLGFLTIFFFIGVFYYWHDQVSRFINIWSPLTNRFPSVFDINYKDYLSLIPIILIFVLGVLRLRENFFNSYISTRKAFQILFFIFIVAIASFYTKPDFRLYHFLLCIPAGSVLLVYYFAHAKRRWFYESLFAFLVITIQYFLFV